MSVPRIFINTVNSASVDLPQGTVWFSYQTPIAYSTPSEGLVIRENDWSVTTGKHLNRISPDKSRRIKGVDFEARIAKAFA